MPPSDALSTGAATPSPRVEDLAVDHPGDGVVRPLGGMPRLRVDRDASPIIRPDFDQRDHVLLRLSRTRSLIRLRQCVCLDLRPEARLLNEPVEPSSEAP